MCRIGEDGWGGRVFPVYKGNEFIFGGFIRDVAAFCTNRPSPRSFHALRSLCSLTRLPTTLGVPNVLSASPSHSLEFDAPSPSSAFHALRTPLWGPNKMVGDNLQYDDMIELR